MIKEIIKESFKGKTIARILSNQLIQEHVTLKGVTLDIGAGKKPSYKRYLKGTPKKYITVDYYEKADINTNLERKLPFKNNYADTILLMSVLEHIYNDDELIDEIHRILKTGGVFYATVPQLLQEHGSPNDYRRYTSAALEKMLKKFSKIIIHPIGMGIFTFLAYHPPLSLIKPISSPIAYTLDTMINKKRKYLKRKYALGFFIIAQK